MSFVSSPTSPRGPASSRVSRFGVAAGLLAVAAFGLGCPPEEANDRKASLAVSAEDESLFIGQTATVTVTSRGADGKGNTDAVSVTVTKAAADEVIAGGIGASAEALAEDPLSLTPDDKGVATFVVGCTGEGTLTLTLATAEVDKEKTLDIRCRVPDVDVSVQVTPFQNCITLQADANSSCEVLVNVRDDAGAAVPSFPVTVRVDSISDITTPEANLSVNGIDDVLVAELGEVARDSLVGITTGDDGQASFFVVSPRVNLEETVNFTVVAGNDSKSASAIIREFADNSAVDIVLDPEQITSGDTVTVKLSAKDLDTTAAAGGVVKIVAPDRFTLVQAGNVTEAADGSFDVSLGDDGTADVDFTAPTVTEVEDFTFTATFQSIPESQVQTDTAVVTVDVAGAVTRTADVDRDVIKASGEPSKSTLTLTAKQDGQPFNDVTATVKVKLASQSIIAIVDPNNPALRVDQINLTSFTDGEAVFDIVADSANARGNGILEIEIDVAGQRPFIKEVPVVVDRDPILQSIVYVGSDPESGIIGVQGSPIATTAVLTFRLLDDNAEPISGLPVSFEEIASDPLVTVDGGLATDANGEINVILNAGRVAAPVVVVATATFGLKTLQAASDAIAIVAGLPNSEHSQLLCEDQARFAPFETSCAVSLGDRFTNFTDVGNVQFRAEGGNISAVGANGSADFAFGNPGPGSADVRVWSYSNITNLQAAQRARFAGCFDNTIRTPCDLIAICTDADPVVKAFCPLRPNATGTNNCVADFSAAALDALDTQGFGESAIAYEIENFEGVDLVAGVDVAAQVAAYEADHRKCGIPLSCLQANAGGLAFDDADDCPVNLGCLDFSGATECPQDGLLDILVSFNGEEGFDDVNGNGVFDANEDFVDFPEPFLDKNSSCSYDDLNDSRRLSPGQKIQQSDLFVDSDGEDGEFGFVINNTRQETNGTYDLSTEVFLKTAIVELAGGRLQLGEVGNVGGCGADLGNRVACSATSGGGTSACTETALGDVFASQCAPQLLAADASQAYVYRWTDVHGNCPSVNFEDVATVEVDGPVELAAGEVALDNLACGIFPGAIDAANTERPWCEEHPEMGSPLLGFTIAADCEGEDGPAAAKLTFSLGDLNPVEIAFIVDCPAAG